MSANAQTNGIRSSNSSIVNTPSSTPVTNGNSQTISQSSPPPNNAPKYGTLVPNRIFVGGISANTTEGELLHLFSTYGTVKAAKIIQDRAGVSRGYGFVTFESEEDAKRPLKDADNIILRERKLNIAPAIKKQPFNRAYDASSPSSVTPGNSSQFYYSPSTGVPYFQGGVTYYPQPQGGHGDPNSQPPTVFQAPPVFSPQTGPPQAPPYPQMMYPSPIYMPQQYPMPPMPYDINYYSNSGGGQYMVGGQNGRSSSSSGANASGSNANGPSSMPLPNSNSSRPACYNAAAPPPPPSHPQLSFTPDSTIYYNMPFYGPPYDASGAIYPGVTAEGLELANGGYSEVSPLLVHDYLTGFDGIEASQGSYSLSEPTMEEVGFDDVEPPNQQPPPTTSVSQPVLNQPSSVSNKAPISQSSSYRNQETPTELPDTTRQTKTPVVSLLSMEQHQEKDLFSMQGGRRVKPQPPQQQQQQLPPQVHTLPPSIVTLPPPITTLPPPIIMQPHFPLNHNQPPPLPQSHLHQGQFYPCNYNGAPIRSQMHYKTGNHNNNNSYNNRDGHHTFNNGWRKQRNYNNSRKYDNNNSSRNVDMPSPSQSNVRTDSNSSANTIVDEIKNEEKTGQQPTAFNHPRSGPPPPPPPFPAMHPAMMHHPNHHNNFPSFNGGGSRTAQNSNSNYYHRRNHNNNNNSFKNQSQPSAPSSVSNRDFKNDNSSSYNKNKNNSVQPTQMRGENGPPSYGAITSTKRNKRAFRRHPQQNASGAVGGGVPSEIGAGDAPLPNNDLVADTRKKLETLKM